MIGTKLFDARAGRQRIDRYEVIGEIASGGMATVCLARLTGMGGFQRLVAIKRLHPHLASQREFVEMFLDEARLAAGIHHPNVVSILEVGASEGGYHLVMEYIEGDTLAHLLGSTRARGSTVPSKITLRIALDLLAGLDAAHELRDAEGLPVELVHRDVSPQNVLVGSDGTARITDFGVAHAASRISVTRAGHQLKGKIAYMAPEQVRGDRKLDRRADVFSAGIVIWEALAARRLFKADRDRGTLSRVLNQRIPELNEFAPDLPPRLCDAVMRALVRDPEGRYQSSGEFADSLEAAAEDSLKVASTRELADFVRQQFGGELTRQRSAIREWIQNSDSLRPGLDSGAVHGSTQSSVSATVVHVPDAQLRSSVTLAVGPRPRWPSMFALVVLGLVGVGGGGLLARQWVFPPPPPGVPLGDLAASPGPETTGPARQLGSPGDSIPVELGLDGASPAGSRPVLSGSDFKPGFFAGDLPEREPPDRALHLGPRLSSGKPGNDVPVNSRP